MKQSHELWLKRLFKSLEIPAPDPSRLLRRIEFMERNVMLPVKAVFIGMILYSFDYSSRWLGPILSTPDVTVETLQFIFSFYILANFIFAILLLGAERLPLAVVQWTVVTSSLVDGLWIAAMAYMTGGPDSILFWLFVALIVRNAISVPPGFSQLFLNVAISLCYALVAVLYVSVLSNTDEFNLRMMDSTPQEDLGEPFVLRLTVLFLTTACCYGAQVLLERQQLAVEEAGEFAAREAQLHSAGRLAAEFAHQIKNPLAVINSTAFSLQRALRENKAAAPEQIEIIQEEVARADKVVTQIMGYAQLSEGRVEKLNLAEELDRAVAQIFPRRRADRNKNSPRIRTRFSAAVHAARPFVRNTAQPASKRAGDAPRDGKCFHQRRFTPRSELLKFPCATTVSELRRKKRSAYSRHIIPPRKRAAALA
jgi:signal transduction histidine kinase